MRNELMTGKKFEKYIVTTLQAPDFGAEVTGNYNKFARRILWIDDSLVDDSFQMNCSWYLKPMPPRDENSKGGEHIHETDEIIGFFSSDPDAPYDLNGEIEFRIEDEEYIITNSCIIFIPKGIKHGMPFLRQVQKPIFHFTTVISGQWEPEYI